MRCVPGRIRLVALSVVDWLPAAFLRPASRHPWFVEFGDLPRRIDVESTNYAPKKLGQKVIKFLSLICGRSSNIGRSPP
jgi:hypothetical protein